MHPFSLRVIGLPPPEEWPTDVTVQRKNFPPLKARPITDFVPEIDEQGAKLLMVSLISYRFQKENLHTRLKQTSRTLMNILRMLIHSQFGKNLIEVRREA